MSYNPVVTLVDNNGVPISAGNPLPTGSSATNPSSVHIEDGTTTNVASVSAGGALKIDGSAVTQPVSFSGSSTVGDGGTSTNTVPDAKYSFNSGGPLLGSGLASGLSYDRVRNLIGKGATVQSVAATVTGNTTLVFGSAAATNLVLPGMSILLTGGAGAEVVYATTSWTPGSSATVPLLNAIYYNGQTSARFDSFAALGPQLNSMSPLGLDITTLAFYARGTGLYQQLSAADVDGIIAGQVPGVAPVVWNGTTHDRWKSSGGVPYVSTGGSATATVAAGTGTTVIKASAGRLCRALVTAGTITGAVTIYDNATTGSGTVIGVIPTTAVIGGTYDFQMPAANGITAIGAAGSAALTVSFF